MTDRSANTPAGLPAILVQYLGRVTRTVEMATLTGILKGLIAESVRLADIYIPPRFYVDRAKVDLPLSSEELKRYRQLLQRGGLAPDQERMLEQALVEADESWYRVLKAGQRVGLDLVWQQLSAHRAVVIQGQPGMGKSTLMERLTLHMAARGLGRPDPEMPEREKLTPALLPVLLRLSNYARNLEEKVNLRLSTYLSQVLDAMDLPALATSLEAYLQNGACLVMLDGLDEVSEPTTRRRVQAEIRALVDGNYSRCRFIITSRVAGYDHQAFPAYPHFLLADLDDQEIDYFLPRWCHASLERERVLRSSTTISEADHEKEVAQRFQELQATLQGNQGVRDLAKNPLLLTLLLVMQQNSVVLRPRRIELYDRVTKTLLENRQLAKDLEPISEFQAIEWLGPVAFTMQEANSELVLRRHVEAELARIIQSEGAMQEEARAEAQLFLQRMSERGGLFVSRVGDYFGFLHRTFQEYFAARYILNNIKNDPDYWIDSLVQLARRPDALWREPFLLAVAYQSGENERVASNLRKLLADTGAKEFAQEISLVMLAASAIIEAKPLTIERALQTEIANRLLAGYEHAQRARDFKTCTKIEQLVQRWLCSLPGEAHRLPLLDAISHALKDSQQVKRQRAVLTLLTMIAQELDPCPPIVFAALISPLLALTSLPAIVPHSPSADLAASADFNVADLALSALSFLGKRGPSGLYLETVRQYFKERPEQLRLLARCSLECGTLITPVVVPLAEENYRSYKTAIGQWIDLRDRAQLQATRSNIEACLVLHQALLTCAEEVSYPTAIHLLEVLRRTGEQPAQPWQEVWQTYLLTQLDTGSYLSYQEAALFWNALFPDQRLQPLSEKIEAHYKSSHPTRSKYAKRFITNITRDLRDLRDLGYSGYLRHLGDLGYSGYLRHLGDLGDLILKKNIVEIARTALLSASQTEKVDLLNILRGRILQFQVEKQLGDEITAEVRLLARAALQELNGDEEVREAALDVLRDLPARTVAEIALLWEILNGTQDEQVQYACADALRHARLVDEAAWQMLEKGGRSTVPVVRKAVEEAMRRKKFRE
jgi:hypothetical protein